ncbi:hypothetical protein B0H16DRAFT_1335464, partial [Mycena metata]
RPKPYHKSTFINLDRTRCAIEKVSGYTPSDEMIWKSIRSTTLHRLSREFLWKCMHNAFMVGDFWLHIDTMDIRGRCHTCLVPESLEHIALECNAHGQSIIWDLTRELWSMKYDDWPILNWGLLLGCNLVKFESPRGKPQREKGRLFTILISIAWHLIWSLRVSRVIRNPDMILNRTSVHNQWLTAVNRALERDRILTSKVRFGSLATKKQLVLNTWSGLLLDEDSLPDNWLYTEGVLVGIQPKTDETGIG